MTDTRSDLELEMQLADEFQSISQVGPSGAVQHAHLDLLHAEQRALSAQIAPSTASRALGGVAVAAAAAVAAIVFGLGTLGGQESITATSSDFTSDVTVESIDQLDGTEDPAISDDVEAADNLRTGDNIEATGDVETDNNIETAEDLGSAGDHLSTTIPGTQVDASPQATSPVPGTNALDGNGPAVIPSTTAPGQYGTIELPTTNGDVAATTSTTPNSPDAAQPTPTAPHTPTTAENATDTTTEPSPDSQPSPTSEPTSPTNSTTTPPSEPQTALGAEPMDLDGLECNGHAVTIAGSVEDDVIVGTPGPDVIAGGNGMDTIYGLDGDDVICGGNGDDIIYSGPGADTILGGNGLDVVEGTPEDNWLQQRGNGPAEESSPNP